MADYGSMSDVGDVDQTPAKVDEAARQRVENQLLDAYAEGRLSDDEFDRRIRSAVEASSPDQLHEATRDIPAAGVRTDDPTVDTAAPSADTAGPSADTATSSAASPASATGPAGDNPLTLDSEPSEFPAYPYGQQAGPSPYAQSAPYAADPAPRAQSPYGPYGAPGGQPTQGQEMTPYDQRVPGRGYPVPAGAGKIGATKATGAIAHFLGLFTWIVGPGIVYAISPAGSDARKEAGKAFNFQVIAMLALIVGGVASIILPNWMDNILFPVLWLGWLLGTVVGGAKAAQGEDWTNPATKLTRLRILSEK